MDRIVQLFLPDELRDADTFERRRAELMIKMTVVLFPLGFAAAASIHLAHQVWLMTSAMAAVPMMLLLGPITLRFTGNMRMASLFLLLPLYAVLTWYCFHTGGLLAPALSGLLLLPLMALICLNARWAWAWMVLVVLTWIALYFATVTGVTAGTEVVDDHYVVRRLHELLIVGGAVFGMFFVKDTLKQWLVDKFRTKEAETRAVVNTAPDGIMTVDRQGTILTANDAAQGIFGADGRRLVGKNVHHLIASLTDENLLRMTDFGAPEEHTAAGAYDSFPVEISFGLLEDDDDPQVVLVFRDITGRKESERQLKRARDEALEASRAKSRFLANMSHELRTPLNAVIGYSEMLLEDSDDDTSQFSTDLERIRSAGKHLLTLINDILELSKIEARRMSIHTEPFELRPLCEEVIDTIAPLIEESGNELILQLPDESTTMVSDPTKVRQILFNLLGNAAKFTEDGTVRLTVLEDEKADKIVFVVEDTGIGMNEEQLDRVFDAFQQADTSTTRQFGGTGLGLTITDHFCTLLDGSIDVESEQGEGTTFTVRLAAELTAQDSN